MAIAAPEQARVCVCVSVPKQLSLSTTSVCVTCNYPTATGQLLQSAWMFGDLALGREER